MDKINVLYNKYWDGKVYRISHKEIKTIDYIGSTYLSKNGRFAGHKREANHKCREVYDAMNKHGIGNFTIQILGYYKCETANELRYYEQLYINKLKPSLNTLTASAIALYDIDIKYINTDIDELIECSCGITIKRRNINSHVTSEYHINLIKIRDIIYSGGDCKSLSGNNICDKCFQKINGNEGNHEKTNSHINYVEMIEKWKITSKQPRLIDTINGKGVDESRENYIKIYKLVNRKDPSKFYIGQAKSLFLRRKTHKSDSKNSNNKLYQYMKEEGLENFDMYLLENTNTSDETEVSEREQYYKDLLKPPLNSFDVIKKAESARKHACKKIECGDCGISHNTAGIRSHKSSDIHKFIMGLKGEMDENKFVDIDDFRILPNNHLQCSCHKTFKDAAGLNTHKKTKLHEKLLKSIQKIKDKKKQPVQVSIEKKFDPNVMFKCDCEIIMTKKSKSDHLESAMHKNIMKIKDEIKINPEYKLIEFATLPNGKLECVCKKILKDEKQWKTHCQSDDHKFIANIIKRLINEKNKT